MISEIHWNDPTDKVPELEKSVIVYCSDGECRSGMMAKVAVPEINPKTGFYAYLGKMEIQWGYEENDFEYWRQLDVVYWAEFPKIKKI